MIRSLLALSVAMNQPIFTPSELKSLPCGWITTTTDTVRGDVETRVRLVDRMLVMEVTGSEVRRTVFIIINGSEHRITASGPISVQLPAPRRNIVKVIYGDLNSGIMVYGRAVCFKQ